jgi:hypothetical protein
MKMSIEHWWNDTDTIKLSTGRKTCPSATVRLEKVVVPQLV